MKLMKSPIRSLSGGAVALGAATAIYAARKAFALVLLPTNLAASR